MEAVTSLIPAQALPAVKALGTIDARFYLAARMRTRTPAGAAEYLKIRLTHEQAWGGRVKLSLDLMQIYRELFPRHYAASRAPHFSTAREHELYRLVNLHLFPLCVSEDGQRVELDRHISRDPNFFLPVIPVQGTQQHDWVEGCCAFADLQQVFQLALVLAWHPLGRKNREAYLAALGLGGVEIAPPLGAYGWSHFKYWISTGGTPLAELTHAFEMISYKTGSPWLDVPRAAGMAAVGWTPHNVGRLFTARRQAEEINARVLGLDRWLREVGAVGALMAIELWNAASGMEAEAGLAGLRTVDLPAAGVIGRFV